MFLQDTPFEDWFLAQVDLPTHPDACWRWLGRMVSSWSEYGRFKYRGKMWLAHRVSYLMYRGPIPPMMLVRHVCPGGGNSWCVNPLHLKLGTHKQNSRDMLRQGRHWSQTGSWHPKQRWTDIPGETREIRLIVPRAAYRTLKRRAKLAGQTLEAYVLTHLMMPRDRLRERAAISPRWDRPR